MQEINQDTFGEEVLKSDKPVVVDFWAPWCGPCKQLAPEFEKVAGELSDVKFVKVNVDDNQGLAQEQGIMGIPCLVIYKDGEEASRIVGVKQAEELKELIQKAV